MKLDRRAFLRFGVTGLGSAALMGLAQPVRAEITAPAPIGLKETNARTVALDNLHTGEKLTADYWVDGAYIPDALHDVNRVLRDFRTGEVHAIEPRLLDLLNQLSKRMETKNAFSVISGYRSPKTNAMLHAASSEVATHSLHMEGMAIDIRLTGRRLDALQKTALEMAVGGVGYYPKSDFVHVDVGRVRRWVG